MIEIFQNHAIRDNYTEINKLGWAAATVKFPAVDVHHAVSVSGSKNWKPEMFVHYKRVAVVGTNDFEEAFELTNRWHNESMVKQDCPMHSMSVGDIAADDHGDFWMVEPAGFKKIEVQLLEKNDKVA